MKECKHCNKKISNSRKFCSSSCSAKFNNKGVRRHGSGPKKIKCENCEKIFEVVNKQSKKRRFCSNACCGLYSQKQTKEKIERGEKVHPVQVKQYLIKQSGHACCICKTEEWMGQPIPLVLDHIDGNPQNNHLSNLRIICANCDHQTSTFAGKNKKNPIGGRPNRMIRYKNGLSY